MVGIMPVSADTLELLISKGITGADLVEVVRSIDADQERLAAPPAETIPAPAKSSGAIRQARYRARKDKTVTSDVTHNITSDVTSVTCDAQAPSLSPPYEINNSTPHKPSPASLRSASRAAYRQAFEIFWEAWPNKVGKPVAERSFEKLFREMGGNVDPIMVGLLRYVSTKPADRAWLNPATFLNQRRFEDRPEANQARAGPRSSHRGPTMAEMAHMDEPGFLDDQRYHEHQPPAETTSHPDQGGSGFAGRLPLETSAYSGRRVVNF